MPAVNPKRRKRLHDRNFGKHADWIRTLPCCNCGASPVDAAHAKPRGMGGCGADKRYLIPLCRACHELFDQAFGLCLSGFSAVELSARLWAESPRYDGRPHPETIRDGREVSRWETEVEESRGG